MQVEQAIFTSVQSGRVQGYQLAAKSVGVDDHAEQALIHWGPSHGSLCDSAPEAESVNFHPIRDGQFALSRTLYGGPEYSQRGGFQLYTRFVLLEDARLYEFEFDAAALYRRARTEGGFQLDARFPSTLPTADLPQAGPAAFWAPPLKESQRRLAAKILELLADKKPVAVFGCLNTLEVLHYLLRQSSKSVRRELSFTTGLKPTANRPFRLHFLPCDTPELRRSAKNLGLECLTAE